MRSAIPVRRLAILLLAVYAPPGAAQTAAPPLAAFLEQAEQALGGDIERLEFTGQGWEACLGQPWSVREGWARWEITDYRRVIDFSAPASSQSAMRRAGLDPGKLGGCGAQPDAAPSRQQSFVGPASSWEQQLALWLTPPGFLRLAAGQGGELRREGEGYVLTFEVEHGGVTYPFEGRFGADFLPRRIITALDDPVFGDMPVEAEFADYRDFGALRFPANLEIAQGGFPVLALEIDSAGLAAESPEAPPARQGGGGGPGQGQAEAPPYSEAGEGVFVMHGAYQAVAVEFADFAVVIDGMQNEARTREVIDLTHQAIPGKPIRYAVITHAHFDHASGLRHFVAEGATLLTHESNADFFQRALSRPRTLNSAAEDGGGQPVRVQDVGESHVIEDGTQRLELHHLKGSLHADDMLIAYLPGPGLVVESDLLQPWINPVFGGGRDTPHPYLVHLADELARLGIDYQAFVPVHRPPQPPLMPRSALTEAVER